MDDVDAPHASLLIDEDADRDRRESGAGSSETLKLTNHFNVRKTVRSSGEMLGRNMGFSLRKFEARATSHARPTNPATTVTLFSRREIYV